MNIRQSMKKLLLIVSAICIAILPALSQNKGKSTRELLQEGYDNSMKQYELYVKLADKNAEVSEKLKAGANEALKQATEYMNKSAEFTKSGDSENAKLYSAKAQEAMTKYTTDLKMSEDKFAASEKYRKRSYDVKNLAEHYKSILEKVDRTEQGK